MDKVHTTVVSMTTEEMEQLQTLKHLSKTRKHTRHGATGVIDLSKLEQTQNVEVSQLIEISDQKTETIHFSNNAPSRNNSDDSQVWEDLSDILNLDELDVMQTIFHDFDTILAKISPNLLIWHEIDISIKNEVISYCLSNIETRNSKNHLVCTKTLLYMVMGLPKQCVGSIPQQLNYMSENHNLVKTHDTLLIVADCFMHHLSQVLAGHSDLNLYNLFANILYMYLYQSIIEKDDHVKSVLLGTLLPFCFEHLEPIITKSPQISKKLILILSVALKCVFGHVEIRNPPTVITKIDYNFDSNKQKMTPELLSKYTLRKSLEEKVKIASTLPVQAEFQQLHHHLASLVNNCIRILHSLISGSSKVSLSYSNRDANIVLKYVTDALLILIKNTKGNLLQSLEVQSWCHDRNMFALMTKYFSTDFSKTQRDEICLLNQKEYLVNETKKEVVLLNLVRILQKMTKDYQLRIDEYIQMDNLRGLKKVFDLDNPLTMYYSLKVFKSCFSYQPDKWRNGQNGAVSLMYKFVMPYIFDKWMVSKNFNVKEAKIQHEFIMNAGVAFRKVIGQVKSVETNDLIKKYQEIQLSDDFVKNYKQWLIDSVY